MPFVKKLKKEKLKIEHRAAVIMVATEYSQGKF